MSLIKLFLAGNTSAFFRVVFSRMRSGRFKEILKFQKEYGTSSGDGGWIRGQQRVLNDLLRTRLSRGRIIWLLAHPFLPLSRQRKRDNLLKGGVGEEPGPLYIIQYSLEDQHEMRRMSKAKQKND